MRMMPETEARWKLDGVKYSCTVVIGKAVLFFGGLIQTRQISQLTPLGLIRIGTLPFVFSFHGTCLLMNSQIFLGFPRLPYNQNENSCWSRLAVLNSEGCEILT